MSVILGRFNYQGKILDPKIMPQLMAHINSWEADDTGIWQNKVAGFGNRVIYNTPESIGEQQPYIDKNSGDVITADVRLDNRAELYKKLSIPFGLRATITDTILLLKAYQKWGKDCPLHLLGAFAFAVWDNKKQQLFCTRDHIGCKPFFYSFNDTYFAFSSEAKTFTAFDDFSWKVSGAHVVNILSLIYQGHSCFYKDIHHLPPAHYIIVNHNGLQLQQYWALDPNKKIKLSSNEAYIEQFRILFKEAVHCRMRSNFPIGCQLSSGLDSGGIAAIGNQIAQKKGQRFITYSNEMPPNRRKEQFSFRDESKQINELISYAGITEYRKITEAKKSYIEELKYGLNLQSYPADVMFFYADRIGDYAKEDGVRTLLSGFVGDHAVSTRCPRYLGYYFERLQWVTLWQELASLYKFPLKGFASTAYGYLKSKFSFSLHPKKKSLGTLLSPSLQKQWFSYLYAQKVTRFKKRRFSNELLIDNLTNHEVENRIQSESLATNAYRIESRYPLTDIRLLNFFLACPLEQKVHKGQGRLLYRNAMQGILPEKLRLMKKRDVQANVIPFEYIHRVKEFKEIRNWISLVSNRPDFQFLDIDLLLFVWDNHQKLCSEAYQGQKLRLMTAKVNSSLQFIELLKSQPFLTDAIFSSLKNSN